jgi:hypothetical protein
VILAVRVLTAKRTAPAAPENPWGRQWRVVSEAEWEAAAAPDHDPKAGLV